MTQRIAAVEALAPEVGSTDRYPIGNRSRHLHRKNSALPGPILRTIRLDAAILSFSPTGFFLDLRPCPMHAVATGRGEASCLSQTGELVLGTASVAHPSTLGGSFCACMRQGLIPLACFHPPCLLPCMQVPVLERAHQARAGCAVQRLGPG